MHKTSNKRYIRIHRVYIYIYIYYISYTFNINENDYKSYTITVIPTIRFYFTQSRLNKFYH